MSDFSVKVVKGGIVDIEVSFIIFENILFNMNRYACFLLTYRDYLH